MKAKQILAIVLALAMLMGLGATAFAEGSGEQPFEYYFIIGDSVTYFHTKDLPETKDGRGLLVGRFPSLVAEHFSIPRVYDGAWAAWRPQEVRVMLEEEYCGDTYTEVWQPEFGGGSIAEFKAWAPEYRAELAKADLITVTLGGNTLMAYSMYVLDRALEKHTAGTPLEKAAMAAIDEAMAKHSEEEALLSILEFISTLQDYGIVVTTILREMPLEVIKFGESWDIMIKDIREINPDAELVCTSMYNAFGNFIKDYAPELGDLVADIGNMISQPLVDAINAHMSCLSSEKNEYTYVDITGIDLTNSADGSHPGGVGHKYIADQVIAAIDKLICSHANTEIVNAKAATKLSLGYSGDTVCSDCGKTLQKGCVTLYQCPHENTALVGAISPTHFTMGYTGNTVCSDCGKIMQLGQVTPSKLFAR